MFSRHMGLWSYLSLRTSNLQLVEVGPERNNDEYIIPPSILGDLQNNIVVLGK